MNGAAEHANVRFAELAHRVGIPPLPTLAKNMPLADGMQLVAENCITLIEALIDKMEEHNG